MNDKRHNTREVPTDFPWKLIEDMTNGFAVEQKIGRGGYGVVYKGVHPNGQEVAVKKLHHMPGLDEDQFQNELRILTGICHPNIVQLIGKSYIEQDRCVEHQGRLVFATMINRAICLEFLPEGSLEKHLSDERSGLRWHNRYKIIKGICDGLKYLHGERIFHLDLKPSNILLDKDMVPKIADFGLSRLFSGTRQSHTTKNLLMTLGYVPPEFVDKGKITNKFDVFSLGVIMIKVLAGPDGRSTYSDMSTPQAPQDFIDLVQGNWRKMLLAAGWKDASYLDAYCNQVKTCTEIALNCVESNSHKRPCIQDIITMLNETEETIDKLYQHLFVVQPPYLCFPFEPDKLIPCPVQLTNNADHHIAYRIQPNTPDIFANSLRGIMPARSTQTYILTMQKQQKPPTNLDTIHIESVVASMPFWDTGHSFTKPEAVHDESKVVKITSLSECASQLASKPRIEVLSLNRAYTIDVYPLEPWVLTATYGAHGIEIWNYKTRAKLDLPCMLPLIDDVVTVSKLIARKQWFVAGDEHGYIHVYRYRALLQLTYFQAHVHGISDLAVHPTESYVLSASWSEGNVKLWDWEKGWECTRIFKFVDFDGVCVVTFLNIKETDTFAVRGDGGIIKICSLRSSEFILSEYKDPGFITCLDHFANGDQQYLITGDYDGTVKIWSMHTQNLVETAKDAHFSSVAAICSDPEHAVLVTGSTDGTVCLWNPNTLRPERTFNFGLGYVKDVKVCTDSSRSYRVVIAHRKGLAMIEMDGNDPVVANTGSSSKVENDLVSSRKRKRPEHDRAEIKNEENDFVVSVIYTGNGAKQTQGIGPRDEEIHSVPKHNPACTCNVCLMVKRRFKTLMMRKKQRQSEREEAEASKKIAWVNREEPEGSNLSRSPQTLDTTRDNSDVTMFDKVSDKGHIDLNFHPAPAVRGDQGQHGAQQPRPVSIMGLQEVVSRPLDNYMKQNGLTSLVGEQGGGSSSTTTAPPAPVESEERTSNEGRVASASAEREPDAMAIDEAGENQQDKAADGAAPAGHSVTDTGNHGYGQTDEEMNSVSSKLLGVYPWKLQLPFKANQLTSCSLKLTNTTDDHVAVRLLTKCPKRYIAKMPLCCIVPPKCIYTLIVTVSDQKKRSQLSSDEFLTLESTICLEQDIVGLQNANLNSEAIEFSNFFKQAKDMAADKVYELKLSVVSNPLKATTSVKQQPEVEVVSNRKFSHVLSLDAHPTEPWILTTNQAGEVAIWDYQVQAIAKSFDFTQRPVYSAKFIAREEWIVAGDGYGMIYVYNYHTKEEVTSIEAHDSDITSLDVHPTDPLVLSSSDDHLIKLWNWRKKNWKCIRTFEGHSDRVKHVKFNPMDTNSFATASLDHTIKIWNISSPESKITMSDHPDGLLCVHSYTIDMRQYLIAGSWDGTAQIWDMETGRLVQTLKGHVRHISCVYHHPELPVVITGSHDGTVRLWNSTTYRLESIVGINLGVVHALGYIKDLRRIVVGCHQGIAIMGLNYS